MKCLTRTAKVLAKDYPPLEREAIERIANDESEPEDIRAMARKELEETKCKA